VLIAAITPGVVPAQDEWEAVSSNGSGDPPAPPPNRPAQAPDGNAGRSATRKIVTVCGERAALAAPPVQAIMTRINGLWGTGFQAWQTIAKEQPHASTGGCVFYNSAAMAALLTYRFGVNDREAADPLVWAIFAHEVGHQVHRDTDASRSQAPSETKELEADRFAGYTLEKLGIRATDLTPYWNLTGDEFGGGTTNRNRHGSSAQRTAAFKQGWHLAEWNQPEDSQAVVEADEQATAPDDPDAAPQ
jgi:hypothetical protein